MPGVEHPVHFTCSAPFGVEAGRLVFYDVIEPDAMSRSSVLSCVAEAGGEAKLPDSVTVSDFRMWLAAVTDSKSIFQSRSFVCMCTIIKVADAVDDKHIDGWVDIAAETILNNALSSSSEETENGIVQGLALLPDHLQHRILAAAASNPQNLDSLLKFFPMRLHASVLAASVTPEKMLRMPFKKTSLPALKALACLPASPPSVLSLRVGSGRCQPQRHLQPATGWPDMLPSLMESLHHHTGLTSLLLHSCPVVATSHQLLLPAIATLTSLQALDLDSFYAFSAESVPGLKQILQALTQLHHLRLRLTDERANSGTKRQRDATKPAVARCCLAGLLSPVTDLTFLSLRISRPGRAQQQRSFFTALKPLQLPHLAEATAIFDDNVPLAAVFLARLSAPLTSLQLSEDLQSQQRMLPATAPAAQHLLHSLAGFPNLRRFSAALPTDEGTGGSVRAALTAALPSLLDAFRNLQSASLSAELDVLHRIVSQLPTAAPSLTQLRLLCCWVRGGALGPAWPEFFEPLCQLKLQHLEWEGWCADNLSAAALRPLTQLTALCLKGWRCMRRPADCQALARMTRLQQLCLDCEDLQLPRDCIATLRSLSSLTSLTLMASEEGEQPVRALVAQCPPPSLPDLQHLMVTLHDPDRHGVKVFTEYIAALPALKRLTVHICPSKYLELDEWDEERHEEQMSDVMAERDWVEACLTEAADSAGVVLTLNTDAYDRLW